MNERDLPGEPAGNAASYEATDEHTGTDTATDEHALEGGRAVPHAGVGAGEGEEPALDAAALRAAAAAIRQAGGIDGLAGHVATLGDALPRSTTEHAVYDLAVALGVWASDLADALDGGCTSEPATSEPPTSGDAR